MPLVFLAIYLIFYVYTKYEKRRRAKRGFWVEYVNPYLLAAGPDDFAIVYHEDKNWRFFYGRINRVLRTNTLTVPDDESWQARMPDWLQAKQTIVITRIAEAYRWVEIVDAPEEL